MSETKWTPGPWRECGRDRDGCSCGQIWSIPADAPVATAIIGDWGDRVAVMKRVGKRKEAVLDMMVYGSISENMGKANARLIAAAPDLYAAAKTALDEMCRTTAPRNSFTDAVEALDAALARARGERT